MAARQLPLLQNALPTIDPHELWLRLGLIVTLITGLFATATAPGQDHLLGSGDIEEQLKRLITFFAPALVDRSIERSTSSDLTIFGVSNDPFKFQPQWRTLFPKAQQHVIEGRYHFPMCDAPTQVADTIRTWLSHFS